MLALGEVHVRTTLAKICLRPHIKTSTSTTPPPPLPFILISTLRLLPTAQGLQAQGLTVLSLLQFVICSTASIIGKSLTAPDHALSFLFHLLQFSDPLLFANIPFPRFSLWGRPLRRSLSVKIDSLDFAVWTCQLGKSPFIPSWYAHGNDENPDLLRTEPAIEPWHCCCNRDLTNIPALDDRASPTKDLADMPFVVASYPRSRILTCLVAFFSQDPVDLPGMLSLSLMPVYRARRFLVSLATPVVEVPTSLPHISVMNHKETVTSGNEPLWWSIMLKRISEESLHIVPFAHPVLRYSS